MKKVFFKSMVGVGLLGLAVSGCTDAITDLYDPEAIIKNYESKWEQEFGNVDPDHTWNTSKRVVANIDLTGVVSNDCLVSIYTANPLTPSTTLLAQASFSTAGSIAFDISSVLNYVYVKVDGAAALNGYYKIDNGIVEIVKGHTRTTSSCTVTKGETLTLGSFHSWQVNGEVEYPGTIYYLNGVTKGDAKSWRYMDYQPLFGKGGIFQEGNRNYELYADQWAFDKKEIVYKTSEAGEIELSYSFGATQCNNMFGYFYFEEGASLEEILNSPKYILMNDAQPETNIELSGLINNFSMHDMALGNWFLYNMNEDGSFQGGNPFVKGSTYKLTYFGEDGNGTPTHEFPAGLNVAFFVVVNGMGVTSEVGDRIWYSMPSLNRLTGKCYTDETMGWGQDYAGDVVAVTYKYGETMVLAFEDNSFGDKDMNDLVFFVAGDFEDDYTPEQQFPIEEPDVTPQEWIIACEDLGGIGDFDFNDVVFKVSYVAGWEKATVTPLAAGGTLAAHIKLGDEVIGEIHSLLGSDDVTKMLNTKSRGNAGTPIEVDVPLEFSMSALNMGGFSVEVETANGKASTVIAAPDKGAAPQMICVPATWAWPVEKESILSAYKYFGDWVEDYSSKPDWYNYRTGLTIDGEGDADVEYVEPADDEEIAPVEDTSSEGNSANGTEVDLRGYVDQDLISAESFGDNGATLIVTFTENPGANIYAWHGNWVAVESMNNHYVAEAGTYEFVITAEECKAIIADGGLKIAFNGARSKVSSIILKNN